MFENRMSGETGFCQGLGEEMLNASMFTGSLLQASPDQRLRRSWTTLSSFGLQALAMGLLLLLPLVRPDHIPLLHRLATPVSLGQPLPDAPPMRAHAGSATPSPSNTLNGHVLEPTRIPIGVPPINEDAPPVQCCGIGTSASSDAGPGLPIGLTGVSGGIRPVLATPPAPAHPIRVSHMDPGSLIYQVQPVYPPLARAARVEGPVVLAALISKDGTIENLRVVTGRPMLVSSAVEAVSKWRYRPYILNSEPVEVETQITVNFLLAAH
ncbi:MAG: energy transducer TonB [Candidatus Sulfotelmatobacter sp.]|jgi:protein TonB